MSYLNPPYEDNFKELCAAMPLFYLDVFEMREVLKAEGGGFELIVSDNFILPADEAAIKKWETALNIVYEEQLTLDQRKQVVIGYICGSGHIGEPEIREVIGHYTSGAVSVAFAKGVITVIIEGEVPGEMTLLDTLLRRIPAHLRLFMQIHIRRVFRQELPVSYGGAVVTAFHPQPVGEDRASVLPLPVEYAGMAVSHFRTQPISEDRTAMLELPVQRGGYVADTFHPLPIGQDRAAGSSIVVSRGGAAVSSFKPEPVGEDKTALSPVSVAHGGYIPSGLPATPPEVRKAATGRSDGAGGLFYQTHTKSKLIE